jgi:hypothetical protein
MNIKLLFLLLLLFLCGTFVKIYDDLNDNNLFEYLYLSKEKEYINNFFIGFNYIVFTLIAINLPIVFLTICTVILPHLIMDRTAFDNPYEMNVILLFFLLALYLLFFENVFIKIYNHFYSIINCEHGYFFMIYFITWYLMYFFDITQFKNVEFGYKKLLIRLFVCILSFIAIIINYFNNYVPNEWLYFFIYGIGYLFTSCIFQIILLYRKNKLSICFKKIKKVEKEKKKKGNSKIQEINICN